jgi:hypothetical protein
MNDPTDHPETADFSVLRSGIQTKLEEMAGLLEQAGDRGAEAVAAGMEELSPGEQAALNNAFGADMRAGLLNVFLAPDGDSEVPQPSTAASTRVANPELVALVDRLYKQILGIETAVVAISNEFMHGGQRVTLPKHVANLRGYVLKLMHDGAPGAVDKVNDYLTDINRWIAACLTAWEMAPERWWSEWWERISPSAIEDEAKVTFLGNRFGEYWKIYREMARDLTPPQAKSQLFEMAGRIARERMK